MEALILDSSSAASLRRFIDGRLLKHAGKMNGVMLVALFPSRDEAVESVLSFSLMYFYMMRRVRSKEGQEEKMN